MATTTGWSGAISLNTMHTEVGEGSSGSTVSAGDGDIRGRMGWNSQAVLFSNYWKAWGCTITHGTSTVPAGKYNSAHTMRGYSKNGVLFSGSAIGSASDYTIASSATSGNTLWFDSCVERTDVSYNQTIIHNGTTNVHTGIPFAPIATDPFRANKIFRMCWNDSARTIVTVSPAPTAGYLYWANTSFAASGSYDVGIRWTQ